jgi:choloylglycine hydrolase
MGMAAIAGEFPLYFEAVNEKGLCMAGLNFPNNAVYHPEDSGKINIAPFEFIPYILGRCKDIAEAEELLTEINLVDINYSDELRLSPLHWLISDGEKSLTVESVKSGMRFYKNSVGVLTNNPPFLKQLENLEKYANIFLQKQPVNNGGEDYSLGLESQGLPGGFCSRDRFVRATFVKQKAPTDIGGDAAVNQLFHILGSVAMPKGCVLTPMGQSEYTRYTCCVDAEKGDYYYTTYDNCQRIKASFSDCDLSGEKLFIYEG